MVALDFDVEKVGGETLGETAAPFDQHDRTREIDVEVVELGRAAEAVGIDVHEGDGAGLALVGSGDDKGRARNRADHTKALADTACHCGFTGTEWPGEQNHVAGFEQARQVEPKLMHC